MLAGCVFDPPFHFNQLYVDRGQINLLIGCRCADVAGDIEVVVFYGNPLHADALNPAKKPAFDAIVTLPEQCGP